MNKSFVIQQLREARAHLDDLIREVNADDNGFGVFQARLPFIYRSLNLAWNSTQKPEEEFFRALKAEGQHRELWGFPHDLDPLIHD
jgi:uncharacterized UPF0160 family protein